MNISDEIKSQIITELNRLSDTKVDSFIEGNSFNTWVADGQIRGIIYALNILGFNVEADEKAGIYKEIKQC